MKLPECSPHTLSPIQTPPHLWVQLGHQPLPHSQLLPVGVALVPSLAHLGSCISMAGGPDRKSVV